ncbi:MAG TPA: hypothetical protein DCS93_24760 [Microscillaceae bacterium]|nr:hypothetical protein [Microscillaceae bacterium]
MFIHYLLKICRTHRQLMYKTGLVGLLLFIGSNEGFAHGFGGTSVIHALPSFTDLAIYFIVGFWSAYIGQQKLYLIPSLFLGGGLIGTLVFHNHWLLHYTKPMIGMIMALIGGMLALDKKNTPFMIFSIIIVLGLFQGIHLAVETHITLSQVFIIGAIIVIGAAVGLLILEKKRSIQWYQIIGTGFIILGVTRLLV